MRGTCRIRIAKDLGGLELVEASHPEPRFGRHSHPTYAIGIVTRGINRFRYRGEWEQAPAGAICTVTPEEVHEVEPAGEVGFAYRCIYPSATQIHGAAEAMSGRKLRRTLALPPVISDAKAAGLISVLFDEDVANGGLARETCLAELLMRVATRHALEPVESRASALLPKGISRAREYLADNLTENISLTDLAAISAMDPFALVRGFTRAYGIPPHAWLVQQRVRRAKELLRAGRQPADVAAALGFADQSHLTRHFRRLLGFTPGRYRCAVQ